MPVTNLIDPENETERNKGKHVKDGFQDPSGSLPKAEYIDYSDLNFRAQGDVTDKIVSRTNRKARSSTTTTQVSKGNIKEPDIPNQSIYPFNRVLKTSAGHLVELDNTPGHERIMVRHKTGSKVEMRANGSIKIISAKDRYTAIAGKDELVVRGNTTVILESDASVRVEGDMELQVEGDMKTLVQGDYNLEVEGDLNERVHGNKNVTITQTYLRDVRGNVTERNLSNYNCWNVGEWTTNIGGATTLTTESTLEVISDGELTMECEGGFIDITSEESVDDSRIVCGLSFAINYHAEEDYHGVNFHGAAGLFTDLDVVNTIEGEAKKATYATTAGQAGSAGTAGSLGASGTASPTTPSPTSPDAVEATPDSSLEAEDVVDTSDGYISDIDRSVYYDNKYNKRKLNTYEVWARLNNSNLRYDSTWLQDQVNYGAIKDTLNLTSSPVPSRTYDGINTSKLGVGLTKLGNRHIQNRGFKLQVPAKPLVDTIPEKYVITDPNRSTVLSPFFTMANMLGGDNNGAQLIDQGGLSKLDIAKNCQLLAFNILEPFREYYNDRWTISHGVYNLLDQEKLNSGSINLKFLQGLAVGVQFDEDKKGIYYDAAVWASNNLVFDKIILSYIDYDPDDINEPTLIISINNGNNSKTLETHYNNELIANELQDLVKN